MDTDHRIRPGTAPLLVGREREQAMLHDRLVAALGGQGGLALIGGEAGIGKTALAEALCREAAEQGALVLVGRCYDLSETPPYGPWREIFERYEGGGDLPSLPAAFAEPGAGGDVTSQLALFTQVRDFIAAVAARQPLVLLLDDVHWADQASLDLLRVVARALASLPILLVVTYRAEELSGEHPLAALLPLLVREANTLRITLRPLHTHDILAVVAPRYRLPREHAAHLVAYLSHRSEGNPFFLGELLRALEEEGIVRPTDDGWALGDLAAAPIPMLLRQVIAGRVRRLGEEVQQQLRVAAVIGQDVPFSIWASVLGVNEEALTQGIEQAMTVHLMEESADGAHARFVHALIRETLYESILPSQRRRIHRQVAEALAILPHPDPDAVAYHFRHAGDMRAFAWFVQAGDRAAWAYAWSTAADRFEAALALIERGSPEPEERGWLLYRLAWARRWASPAQGIAYLNEAEQCASIAGDRGLAAYAAFTRGTLHCIHGNLRQGLQDMAAGVAARRALTTAERTNLRFLPLTDGTMETADGQGTLVQWLATVGRFREARDVGNRALAGMIVSELPKRSHDSSYGDLYLGLAQAYAGLGLLDDAHDAFERAFQIYRSIGHDFMVGMKAINEFRWMLPYRADHPTEFRRLLAEAEEAWARAVGSATGNQRQFPKTLRLLLDGKWIEARQQIIEAATNIGVRQTGMLLLSPMLRAQGDGELAWAFVRTALPDGPATEPGNIWFPGALTLIRTAVELALDASEPDTARTWLETHDRWVHWGESPLGRADGEIGWALYHRAAGDRALAAQDAERALKEASAPRQPLVLLAAHRLLGELATEAGRFEAAQTRLDAALTLADACALPFERALTLFAQAAVNAAIGNRADALALLDEVRAICFSLGAAPTIARVDALAAQIASVKAIPLAHPAGLSTREMEVLRLLVAGQTNREIADALSISIWTVKQHVAHILNKTTSENRSAAVAFAIRHHLA